MANFCGESLTIPKSTVLGVAESVSETWMNLVNSDGQTTAKVPTEPCRKEAKPSTENYCRVRWTTCPENKDAS